MKIELISNLTKHQTELNVFSCFNKNHEKNEGKNSRRSTKQNKKTSNETSLKFEKTLQHQHWPKELQTAFNHAVASKHYKAEVGETFTLTLENGQSALILGLGEKSKLSHEVLRKQIAHIIKAVSGRYTDATIHIDGFLMPKDEGAKSLGAMIESIIMTSYVFDRHLSTKKRHKLEALYLSTNEKKPAIAKFEKTLQEALIVGESINVARDFINEPPNILNSVSYAKEIEKDAKSLKNVKIKTLGVPELKKENMNMFLAVNAGSAHDARLVHLTYTPAKSTSKTKHIALVGKGLTFDTGGYSLKPGASMMTMKFDMAGSATVYAAFRAATLLKLPVKISCFLGLTDNAVNEKATMPDSIVRARNGKTVEILNTDAEGRLVLGDVVNYACDFKPDAIIDAATLTGAILVALGSEVCGLFSNDDKLAKSLLASAKSCDEYMWQLPIIDEHKNDIKATVADLKNMGSSGHGGSAKGAAFIEQFLTPGIPWAHLDIAGIGDSQGGHLPYCPNKGASGLIIRSLLEYLKSQS